VVNIGAKIGESRDWRELLLDLKRRGRSIAPELAVADGGLGFWYTFNNASSCECTRRQVLKTAREALSGSMLQTRK
jgi:transposase-like protein